jgi:predicted permease
VFQRRFEKRLDREMRFHLDAATQAYVAKGMTLESARSRALSDFGAVELAKDEMRDLHPLHLVEQVWRVFAYAGRQLRKSPAFSFTVLLTLALCIGANTAIFSVVDQVFFQALPYPRPDQLMMIARSYQRGNLSDTGLGQSFQTWTQVRDHAALIDAALYSNTSGVNLFVTGHVEYVQKQEVGTGFFRVLGVSPLVGREFTRQEDVPGGPAVAVISYGLWQRMFNADPSTVGRSIDLAGAPHTVVGIMPKGFKTDAPQAQVWTALKPSASGKGGGWNYEMIARLKPGVTASAANAQLASISPAIASQLHVSKGVSFALKGISMQKGRTFDVRTKVKLLWAASALVLIIGCLNIAGILLARSATRAREIATRFAVGGTRSAIVGQLLAESTLLGLLGGALGFVLAYFLVNGAGAVGATQFNLTDPLRLNFPAFLLVTAVSLLAGLAFGLFPALEVTAMDLRSALNEAARGGTLSQRQRKRQLLVFAEVALGVVLVTSAGLLLRTLSMMLQVDPGFRAKNIVTASLSLEDARYKTTADATRLFRTSLDQILTIPGIESGAVALSLPYQLALNLNIRNISGHALNGRTDLVNFVYATPSFFETLRIPLLRGRYFTARDSAGAPKVAVVDQALIDFYLPKTPDPLGQQINLYGGSQSDGLTIVGVVNNIPQQQGWSADAGPVARLPQIWVPAAQLSDKDFQAIQEFLSPSWVVRTRGHVANLEQQMRRAILNVDPRLPFSGFHTIEELRSDAVAPHRYQAMLFSVFGGMAILLCMLGLYGLIAQSIAQRTREFGIRLALGADLQNIIRSAVFPGIKLCIAGITCGVVLSLWSARLLKTLVWGISTTDTMTYVTVAALLITVAVLTSLIPALRLAKLDPAETLRDE